MKKIDLLAIGDIVIDAFIKLKDAHINCNLNKDSCELCVKFRDKIPYEEVYVIPAVGNSPNAAVASARLGLSTALFACIGKDKNGEECLDTLEKEKINTKFIQVEKGKKTNYHYVLWYDVDRTILIKHESFDRVWDKKLAKRAAPKWIYLSSLGENSLPFHENIVNFLKENPETKMAFQPGTFQIKFGTDALKDIYAHTEVFFCNLEEAQRILKTEEKDLRKLSEEVHALGPKMVVISDGPNGAYLFFNNELWQMPIYPDIAPPFERTGAGDAFSSTFTVALALGKTPLEALAWGPINSMSVVQEVGAQKGLLSREKLEEYLKNAPESYKPTKIS